MSAGLAAGAYGEAELVRAFEERTLPPAAFTHRAHLAVGWSYLQRYGFPQGALRFREQLLEYVASVGARAKYHETITWAYLVLLNEELTLSAAHGESFAAMIERRPDLLDHRRGAIARCYAREQLELPQARHVFMLPRAAVEPSS